MGSESGATTSCWMDVDMPRFPPLGEDCEADACVVGAGIAGLSCAYHLAREGRSVVVLDDGAIGGGETGRSTAHLMTAFDDRYVNVERLHGEAASRLVAQSHAAAIDRVEAIVAEEALDCGFRRVDGYLFAGHEQNGLLHDELQAARRAGLADVELLECGPLTGAALGPVLKFPRQGQLDPMRYLAGLARAVTRMGGRVHCGSHVDSVEDGAPATVITADGHRLRAAAVIVATNSPINDRFAIHTKQAPYRTFVVGLPVRRHSVPRAQFWDTLDPYHYVRVARRIDDEHDLLIVGGEDHKTGQADDAPERFARLEGWARERFPVAGPALYRWSGQVMEPADALAFIGRNPGSANVYVATGDSGNGMTHGTIAGMLLADLVARRPNPWAALYDPSRKPLRALGEYARENANVAAQYRDWATAGDVPGVEAIPPGGGAVLRQGTRKLAVHRGESGELCVLDARCPHLGCVVSWNSTEHTWDCPCHGSRFDARGAVVNGPAASALKPAEPR